MARRLRLQVESISFASLEDVTYSGRSLDTCRRTRLQHGSIKRLEKTSESPLLDFLKKKRAQMIYLEQDRLLPRQWLVCAFR